MNIKFYALFTTILSFLLLTVTGISYGQDPFVTVWKTDNTGVSGSDQIIIPATGDFTYIWVDVANTNLTGLGSGSDRTTITFPQAGIYELSIVPTGSKPFDEIWFAQFVDGDKNKLIEVSNWGSVVWNSFQFNGCPNINITATDIPDLSNVTDLSFAFSNSGVGFIPNVNDWDVSHVTNMANLFEECGFNQSLSKWDVSKVTNMSFMFSGASNFNQSLESWDVSSLKNADYMFRDAVDFNQSLGAWDLTNFVGSIGMFIRTGISCENYSLTLYEWATNPNTANDVIFYPYGGSYSPNAVSYRDYLINSLDWTINGDALGTCIVALAVELTNFTASGWDDHTQLQWSTVSETNNKGFQIERSSDGSDWETVGFVHSQFSDGNSSQKVDYDFHDNLPLSGTNYYRLKQIDFDGAYAYSQVRYVTFGNRSAINLYPNPAKDYVVVSGLSGKESIKLYDLAGKELEISLSTGNPKEIYLSHFPAGVYYLVLTLTNGSVVSQKVVKQ